MNRGMKATAIVSAVIIAMVGLLALGAFAQDRPDEGWGPARGGRHWGPDPEQLLERRAELAADLGEQLDRTPAEVEAAFRAVVGQRLDEAVSTERITREEADEALAAYDDGELFGLIRAFKHDAP
ncbi:MAG: hypothetical protein ACRDZO_03555 [Egibacteraceae bacterium]